MSSKIAALRGTTSLYCYLQDSKVLIIKEGYQHMVVESDTFNYLYYELDGERAALKEDCIDYVVYIRNKPLVEYPDWYIEAYDNGYIFEELEYDDPILYNDIGDTVLEPGSVVLRNYKGQLSNMDVFTFAKYYDVVGEDYEC